MTAISPDWSEAFFDAPEAQSLDGGTTTSGALWHEISSRWGHSMHTMCSYHGMFPAKVAHYFIERYSRPGNLVLDPFSGRGTVGLQARVEGRRTIANDLNPLAYVLTKAKVDPPSWSDANAYLTELESSYRKAKQTDPEVPDDIRMLFHSNTLHQIVFLRKHLLRHPIAAWTSGDAMLAGCLAGITHGSHRRDGTSQYLSISMPNTFSMSPTYVRNYIKQNRLLAPDQDVFECLRVKLARLYLDGIEGPIGSTRHDDAAVLLSGQSLRAGSVDLVVTSPPYLQVVNYGTANWIRLWVLGVDDVGRDGGSGRRTLDAALDHRHNYSSYGAFLLRTLLGIRRVLRKNGVAVLVVGDVANPGESPLPLAARIWKDVGEKTGLRLIELIEDDLPVQNKVSRIWGDTKGQATDRDCVLVLGRADGEPGAVTDVINWDESYKDSGPDAAHLRLRPGA
jgi:site-specific DNA-methyltransferase (adenine-specific)